MENIEFENKLKEILVKMGKALDINLDWVVVSCDYDVISDFGCDRFGNLTIVEDVFPLKIKDLSSIRYRVDNDINKENYFNDDSSYIRFEFEDGLLLNCHINACNFCEHFYFDNKKIGKYGEDYSRQDTIKKLNELYNTK